jgi:hypothetical protein
MGISVGGITAITWANHSQGLRPLNNRFLHRDSKDQIMKHLEFPEPYSCRLAVVKSGERRFVNLNDNMLFATKDAFIRNRFITLRPGKTPQFSALNSYFRSRLSDFFHPSSSVSFSFQFTPIRHRSADPRTRNTCQARREEAPSAS